MVYPGRISVTIICRTALTIHYISFCAAKALIFRAYCGAGLLPHKVR